MHPSLLPTHLSRAFGVALLSTLACWTGTASASPDYPSIVKGELPMPCTPDCTICHSVTPGKAGTADKPFVLETLLPRGLTSGKNPQALMDAIDRLKTNPADTDADGVQDHIELDRSLMPVSTGQETTDPNTPEGIDMPSANICPPEPAYGCGAAHVTRKPHGHAEYLLVALFGSLAAAGIGRRLARRRST